MNDVININRNKHKTLRHAPLELYKEGIFDLEQKIDRMDRKRAVALGALLGGLTALLVVVVISYAIALLT